VITLSRDQWFGLSELLLDDSASAVDVPWTWTWDEDTDLVTIEFADPREHTVFLLRYADYLIA
jgi:hypothetical protein